MLPRPALPAVHRREPNPRPLVVRFGAMGDMVMLTAMLDFLAERFQAPCDVVASQGSPQLVFRELPIVGDVYTIQSRRRAYWLSADQRELVRQLRRRGPSPTFLLDDLPKVRWLMQRSGIPAECIVSTNEGRDLSGHSGTPARGDLEHFVDFAHRLALTRSPGPLGIANAGSYSEARSPILTTSQSEREECRRWIRDQGLEGHPLVLLQTLSRRAKRGRWPAEHWRQLSRAILEQLPGCRVLLTGSPEEARLLGRLEQDIGLDAVRSVASELPLRRLFALLEMAHSCVSIDTGPAHAAAALGCPLVILFGRADPRRNLARGRAPIVACTAWPEADWPASRRDWESRHRMAEIDPQEVIAAWRQTAIAQPCQEIAVRAPS